MDGTIKHFTAIGNARECDYIQDRYGNTTNLTYTTVVINSVNVALLNTDTDPSGRRLLFHWSNLGTGIAPAYRIVQVDGPQYSVVYGYGTDYNLSSATVDASTPAPGLATVVAGPAAHTPRTTSFTYATVSGESGLLSNISDPLGHNVTYSYTLLPAATNIVWVTGITQQAGVIPNTTTQRTQTWTISPYSYTLSYIGRMTISGICAFFANNGTGNDLLTA